MSNFQWVGIALITVLSAARLTRLLTFDDFPPIAWVRNKFINWSDKTAPRREWQIIAFCGYCMSFWVTLVVVLWGWGSGWTGFWGVSWWLLNGALAASYAAAVFMANDGDNGEDEG